MTSLHKMILAILTVALCFVVACGKTASKNKRHSAYRNTRMTNPGPQNQSNPASAPVTKVETIEGETGDRIHFNKKDNSLSSDDEVAVATTEIITAVSGTLLKEAWSAKFARATMNMNIANPVLLIELTDMEVAEDKICDADTSGTQKKLLIQVPLELKEVNGKSVIQPIAEDASVYTKPDTLKSSQITYSKLAIIDDTNLSETASVRFLNGYLRVNDNKGTDLRGEFRARICK